MRRLSLILLAVLSILFLLLISPYILHPELYTSSHGSATFYHADPSTQKEYSGERSDEIQAMMQDLLDFPQSIILNLQRKDFEQARREFEEYQELSRDFNGVVVSLKLNESALGDFQRSNRLNVEVLERILKESARSDEISRLEVQYLAENNKTLLYSIVYEGKAANNALKGGIIQFTGQEPDILNTSAQLHLDPTRYQAAVDLLAGVGEEDQKKQEERELNRPLLPDASISMTISPDRGRYGEALLVTGAYPTKSVQGGILVLDGTDWKILLPDANGIFSTIIPIGMIRAGEHVVIATTGSLYSDPVTFTVIPTETALTFDVYTGGGRWDEMTCYGTLYAGEVPVSGAPVRILADNFEVMTVETDSDGYFYGTLSLEEGDHALWAVFDDPDFPLTPSESVVQPVNLTPEVPLLLAIGVGAGLVLFGSLGAIWYLRREEWQLPAHIPELSTLQGTVQKEMIAPPQAGVSRLEFLKSTVHERYEERRRAGEWSGAALLLYQFLIACIIPQEPESDPSALTPRELAAGLSGTSVEDLFLSFVERYEEIRYGGLPLLEQDPLLSVWDAILVMYMDRTKGAG
jgi:hypothetical protein